MEMNPGSTSVIASPMPPREVAAIVRQASREVAMLRARAQRIQENRGSSRPFAAGVLDEALALCSQLVEELAATELRLRKGAKEAQNQREHRDYLFDRLPMACLCTDQNGWITRANRSAALMLRTGAKHLAEKALLHFTIDRAGFMKILQTLRQEQRQLECTLSLRPREHAPIHRRVTITPDPEGGWLWFFEVDGPGDSRDLDLDHVSCNQP